MHWRRNLTWTIEFRPKAVKQFRKLDRQAQLTIRAFLRNRLQNEDDPRRLGAPLKGEFKDFWRYRVGDYRLVCDIHDQTITIEVLKVAHRRDIYDRQ